VGVVKGPNRPTRSLDEPAVYLEVYYKYGEWDLREGTSEYIDQAMGRLEQKMGEEEWNALSAEVQKEAAIKLSILDVENQRGWGVVKEIAGTLVAKGSLRF